MARVYIGVGSNVDPEANIRQGIQLLRRAFGDLIVSPVYESPAVGFAGDNFYNLVVGFDTVLDPKALIQALHTIEIHCGRERGKAARLSPRTLDLDLLLYGDWVLHEEKLELPRRDILEYAFVLRPLADIAGDLLHPVSGQRIEDLWQRFERNAQPLQPLNPVNLFLETE
jgi:2-amino-4-hydroxy-6-hydroxymethyldihydropteridine diphosphokinase